MKPAGLGVDCPGQCRAVWEPKRVGRRRAIEARGFRRLQAIILLLALMAPAAAAENVDRFLSFAGITLDETETLDDVTRRFGAAALQESGEAGEYLASVCYSTDTTLVYFRSHEMGGPEHRVLGFAISRPRDSLHCAPAPSELKAYGTEIGGLKLGMSVAQFTKHLGGVKPIEEHLCRYFEQQRPLSEAERSALGLPVDSLLYEQVSVCGRFEQDALVEYEIWRVQTH